MKPDVVESEAGGVRCALEKPKLGGLSPLVSVNWGFGLLRPLVMFGLSRRTSKIWFLYFSFSTGA